MSKYFKFFMLITSFLPLWISILFSDFISIFYIKSDNIGTEIITIIIILVLSIVSVFNILKCIKLEKVKSKENILIEEIILEKTITVEYLLSYVLPLFAFDFTLWFDCIKFLIYFFCIGYLSIKNDNVYTNIFLEILGYKIYRCRVKMYSKAGKEIYLISKDNILFEKDNTLEVIGFNNLFYIYKR